MDVVDTFPQLPNGYTIVGSESDHPEIVASIEFGNFKVTQILTAYNLMNSEIFTQMYSVYKTTRSDSAMATQETWKLMLQYPAEFAVIELIDDLTNNLDTEQKILDYANLKLLQSKDYAIYRLNRIKQFRIEREQIINS